MMSIGQLKKRELLTDYDFSLPLSDEEKSEIIDREKNALKEQYPKYFAMSNAEFDSVLELAKKEFYEHTRSVIYGFGRYSYETLNVSDIKKLREKEMLLKRIKGFRT